MPEVSVDNLGQFGLNTDLPDTDLPPNAFNSGINVRFSPAGLETIWNYSDQMLYTVPTDTLAIAYWESGADRYWVSGSPDTLDAHNGTSSVVIGSGYAATEIIKWQFTPFAGVIANNGVDEPQYWDGDFSAASVVTLPNWPTGDTCRVFRSFKNYGIALNITSGGTNFPNRVVWSDPAEPGEVPASWDVTSDIHDAGATDIGYTPGEVVDGVELGEVFCIYKEDSIHGMQYIGPPLIFKFFPIITSFGALGTNCVIRFPGGHFVVTQEDVIIHDGSGTWRSVISNRRRRALFSRISESNRHAVSVQIQPAYNEIWILIPPTAPLGSSFPCNLAFTWNWETGAWGARELPDVFGGDIGLLRPSGSVADLWSTSDGTLWKTNNQSWDGLDNLDVDSRSLVLVSTGVSLLRAMDLYSPTVEIPIANAGRSSLAIVGRKEDGSYKVDQTLRKQVNSIWPRLQLIGDADPTISIYFDCLEGLPSLVEKAPEQPVVNPITRTNLRGDVYGVNGVYFGIYFTITMPTEVAAKVILVGYTLDLTPAGKQIP